MRHGLSFSFSGKGIINPVQYLFIYITVSHLNFPFFVKTKCFVVYLSDNCYKRTGELQMPAQFVCTAIQGLYGKVQQFFPYFCHFSHYLYTLHICFYQSCTISLHLHHCFSFKFSFFQWYLAPLESTVLDRIWSHKASEEYEKLWKVFMHLNHLTAIPKA